MRGIRGMTTTLATKTRSTMIRMQSTAAPHGLKEDLSQGATFRFQDSLPQLPVPTLQETAKKYLRSVKAVVLPEDYARTEKAVAEFIKPGGQGEVLQKRLQDRAADPNIRNWIYDWWNEAAYMAYRDPVVPYVSYFYSHNDDSRFTANPAKRASYLTAAALKFKNMLDTKTLEPDYMRKAPIDMELFKFLFHNCRIPKPNVDGNVSYPVKGNEHIIVIRRNRFYKVPYLTKEGRPLSVVEFEKQFKKVLGDADLKGTGPNVGGLSSENRDTWVTARDHLVVASSRNAANIEAIQSAAFVVCLDWAAPVTPEERVAQYWHGYGKNRFYDKPAQFIVCDNGNSGFMGEHSMMDGTQTLRLNDYVCDEITNKKLEITTTDEYDGTPEELVFDVNDTIKADIVAAEKQFNYQINQHEVKVWVFEKYGKDLIKKFKCSPDAYIQMLLQLAYYKMNGTLRGVYESATTRKYFQGRTETTRSVSVESADFVKAFVDSTLSNKEKIDAFRLAVDSQVRYVADASEGKGVDRHLFGLKKLIQQGEPIPAIYQDPAFGYSSTWYISSSQLSSVYFNGYGWSQVTDDGFGCAYMINPSSLQVNICSKKLGSPRFAAYLEESAEQLAELLGSELNRAKL